jgi:hypothetical protein
MLLSEEFRQIINNGHIVNVVVLFRKGLMKKVILSIAEQKLSQEFEIGENFEFIQVDSILGLARDADFYDRVLALVVDLNSVYQRVEQRGGSWHRSLGQRVVEKIRSALPENTALIGVTTIDCFKFEMERWGCDACVLNNELLELLKTLSTLGFQATFSPQC